MADGVSTATIEIEEPVSSTVSKHTYRVTVKDEAGRPVTGQDVTISMVGSGGFATNFHSDEIKRALNDAGEADFTWYRRGIFTRGVKATVTVSFDKANHEIALQRIEDETGVTISYKPTEFKIPPPRV